MDLRNLNFNVVRPVYDDLIEIFVEGDENDMNYVNVTRFLSLEDFEVVRDSLVEVIKSGELDNFPEGGLHTLTEFDLIPMGQHDMVYKITEVAIWFRSREDGIRYEVIL